MPAAVAGVVCRLAGLGEEIQAAQITRAERNRLAEIATGLPLAVTGTEGFEHSMVTRGGVSLKEVDPHTLESRKTPGLFFAGEVLDLDGPCGGYNLQWAFSSGLLAGRSAAKR
jgi:predicted flavoprotein YhiN